MATHSSVLAWRIPGAVEPGGLPSMGSHRVGHDWSDLAVAAAISFSRASSQPRDRTQVFCITGRFIVQCHSHEVARLGLTAEPWHFTVILFCLQLKKWFIYLILHVHMGGIKVKTAVGISSISSSEVCLTNWDLLPTFGALKASPRTVAMVHPHKNLREP